MSEKELSRLIILGAGASVECGVYPTGAQFLKLVEQLIDQQKKKDPTFQRTKDFEYLQNLLASGHSSIDAHISYINNDDEKAFLKAIIFAIITTCTAYSSFRKTFENRWYHELAKLIFPTTFSGEDDLKKFTKIKENLQHLQIITFNYDVSLELYLLDRAHDFFGRKDDVFLSEFLKILLPKVYHVYGSVASEIVSEDDVNEVKNGKVERCAQELINVFRGIRNSVASGLPSRVMVSKIDFAEKASGLVYVILKSGGNISVDDKILTVYKTEVLSRDKANLLKKSYKDRIQVSVSCGEMIEFGEEFFSKFEDLMSFPKSDDSKTKVRHREAFLDVVFGQAKYTLEKEPELLSRIKVIAQDRVNSDPTINEIASKSWDVLYVLGYGFDRLNNFRLEFQEIRSNLKKGCFVTNFEGTPRMEREIFEQLSQKKRIDKQSLEVWQIPTEISPKNISVSVALREFFSLMEEPFECATMKIGSGMRPWQEIQQRKLK